MKTKILSAAMAFMVVVWGCSDDKKAATPEEGEGDHKSPFPSCQAIIDVCHPVDVGEGPASECHDVAHDDGASEEKCAARKTECLATCAAAAEALDGGGADTGAKTGAADSGSDANTKDGG